MRLASFRNRYSTSIMNFKPTSQLEYLPRNYYRSLQCFPDLWVEFTI